MTDLIESLLVPGPNATELDVVECKGRLFQARAMMDIALPHLDNTELYRRLDIARMDKSSAEFISKLRDLQDNKIAALEFVFDTFGYDRRSFRVGRFDLDARPRGFV